jgi:23S rRNA (adenine2503-C2)-methyltransferase
MPYLHPPEDLGDLLDGEPHYRIDQLRQWLYETPVLRSEDMTNLPAALRARLTSLWPFDVEMEQSADGGTTRKWLFRAPDGAAIESVLMGYPRRATLCISSQAGCALGCTFCATGQFGFERHLDAGEIVAQVAYARAFLRQIGMPGTPDHLTNVVFMGMGEPLQNLDAVLEACEGMNAPDGLGLSARRIAISTVGWVPGIARLAEHPLPVRLAISLHAADDRTRGALMPINARYPIASLLAAARRYCDRTGRRVFIEYLLLDGVNDSPADARRLAGLLRDGRFHVNVIEYNPTDGGYRASPQARREVFLRALADAGLDASVRRSRGADVAAACGQLARGR